MLFLLNIFSYLLAVISITITSIYAYFLYSYQYWARKKINFLEPKFPLGNCHTIWTHSKGIPPKPLEICYDKMKKIGWKYGGFFTIARPSLLILDTEYIKDILVKDFHHFVDRGFYYSHDTEVTANLFIMDETHWKNVRTKLTPTFTSGKMKMMFPLLIEASNQMVSFLDENVKENKDIDTKECLAMFTTDVIVSCALGIDSNCFTDPNNLFRAMGKLFFNFNNLRQNIEVTIMNYAPKLAELLGIPSMKKEVVDFFINIVSKTMIYRKDNSVTRDDFLQLVINLHENTKSNDNPLSFEQIVSQVSIFFIAGFETSSSTMNFALYELAKNPIYQDKVRKEIVTILKNNDDQLTYESIKQMTYLNQIVEETLRLYPVLTSLQRKCIKDYTLRDTNVTIEKGVPVYIPLLSIQRDPDYFEDPLKFDPDRFSPENREKIAPYTYLPFGDGPRHCIGLRFGLMQVKVGLIQIIKNFNIKISPSTKTPLEINKGKLLLYFTDTLYLQAEKL